MKAVADPSGLVAMPSVAAWLRHADAAQAVVDAGYPDLAGANRARAITLENLVAQLVHLRTHPAVAAAVAQGALALHGWFVDLGEGRILGLDGVTGRFAALDEDRPLPVALPHARRRAAA